MPRYIDADKLIELANHDGAYGYVDVHDILNIPAADVVEVVRCKDCKHYYKDHYFECAVYDASVQSEDFCAFGERIKNND